MNKLFALVMILIAAMFISPASVHANLLSNAGFETNGGYGGATAANWTGSGDTGVESWAAYTGSWGMKTGTYAASDVVYQEVAVAGSTPYAFSIWGQRDGGTPTGTYQVNLAWYNGATPLTVDGGDVTLTDGWTQQLLNATSPATANKVRATFGGTSLNLTGKWDDADLSSSPIPEPTSMLLLGSGLVGLLGLRKRTVK